MKKKHLRHRHYKEVLNKLEVTVTQNVTKSKKHSIRTYHQRKTVFWGGDNVATAEGEPLAMVYIFLYKCELEIQFISQRVVSNVYGIKIPDNRGLTNIDICGYAQELGIQNFRGVFMRDTLPRGVAHQKEGGIVDFNISHQSGSHWVCYFKDGMKRRIYLDTFGQVTPAGILKYLKTKKEYNTGKAVIQRNADIVQHVNTHVCGHLCLFVLTSLTCKHQSYQLNDGYTQRDC